MRALTYHGSMEVQVDTVPDPLLREPTDIILKVTATNRRGCHGRLKR